MWSCWKLVRQTFGCPTWLGWHDDMEPVDEELWQCPFVTHRGCWSGEWWRHRIWQEFRFKVPRCTDPATGTRTEERMFICVGGVCLKKMRLCELMYIYRNILQFPLCIWYTMWYNMHTVSYSNI
jgi:hypothetical protein